MAAIGGLVIANPRLKPQESAANQRNRREANSPDAGQTERLAESLGDDQVRVFVDPADHAAGVLRLGGEVDVGFIDNHAATEFLELQNGTNVPFREGQAGRVTRRTEDRQLDRRVGLERLFNLETPQNVRCQLAVRHKE